MELLSKADKLKIFSELNDEQINVLYVYHKKKNKAVVQNIIKNTVVVNKDSDQYKILLKLINKILKNINKEEITDLLEFKNIDREFIIAQKDVYEEMEEELYKYYDKIKCGWYSRKNIKNFILTFLRHAVSIIGYEFSFIMKDTTDRVGDVNYRKKHIFYSVK